MFQSPHVPEFRIVFVREPVDYEQFEHESNEHPEMALPIYFPQKYAVDVTNISPDPKAFELIEELLTPFADMASYKKLRSEVDGLYNNSSFLCKQVVPVKRAVGIILNICVLVIDDIIEDLYEKPDIRLVEGVLGFFTECFEKNRPLNALEYGNLSQLFEPSMIHNLSRMSELMLNILDYHVTVGFLQWHADELRKCMKLYLFYMSNYEMPSYRSALFDQRPLSDVEWRNYRWHSMLMVMVSIYEWSDDLRPDIVPINDSMFALVDQSEGLRNDIYSYPKDVAANRIMIDNRVYQLMHNKNMSMRHAMINVAARAQKMISLLMDIADILPEDAKKFIEAGITAEGEATSWILETKRYAYSKVKNVHKSTEQTS